MTHSEIQVEIDYSTGIPHKKNNLWLHLTSWNLPDSQLCLESKTDPSVAEWGGDTAQKTDILEGGDTAHTLLRWGHCTYLIGVGSPYIAYWGGDTAQH